MADFYRAREAFAVNDENGCPRPITPGTVVRSDDPAYKGRETFFEPLADSVARATAARTETATAAPGELRHVFNNPAKKAARKAVPPPTPSAPPAADPTTDEPKGE